jgi:hypothetical protein
MLDASHAMKFIDPHSESRLKVAQKGYPGDLDKEGGIGLVNVSRRLGSVARCAWAYTGNQVGKIS